MPWRSRSVSIAGLAAICVTVVVLSCRPVPSLLEDLPETIESANAEFDRRVRERFPIGSSEIMLINELARRGWAVTTGPNSRHASFRGTVGLFVQQVGVVSW